MTRGVLSQGEREPYLSLNATSVELPARSDDSRPGGGKQLNFHLHFEHFVGKWFEINVTSK